MLKLLARSVTSQCLVIGCSILVLSWKIGYLWLKGPFKTMCKWNYAFSSIIHKHEILDTRERERKDELHVTTWGNHLWKINQCEFIFFYWPFLKGKVQNLRIPNSISHHLNLKIETSSKLSHFTGSFNCI
jgi:hypothetical protein